MGSKIKKRLFYFFLALVLSLSAFYFLITSNLFLTKVVAPVLSRVMYADFTVGHAKYNPFTSYLEVHDVVLGDKDNPFIVAKSAHGYVDLFAISKYIIKFRDVYVDGIDINFVQNKKGKWSIPWLYMNIPRDYLVQIGLDFPNINAKNMNVKFQGNIGDNGTPLELELNNLKVSSKHFKSGLLSPIKYKGNIKVKSGDTAAIDKGNVDGELSVNLDSWCIPSHINISTIITDMAGKFRNNIAAERDFDFNVDIKRQGDNPYNYDINYIRARDSISTALESDFITKGELKLKPLRLSLNVKADPICSPILNTVSYSVADSDLGNAELSYLGDLLLTFDEFKSAGKLLFAKFSSKPNRYLAKNNIPLLDFFLSYNFGFNFNEKTAFVKTFDSTLSKGSKKLIVAKLKKPFTSYYENGENKKVAHDPVPVIDISTNLNLKLLNEVLNENVQFFSGTLDSNLALSIYPYTKDFVLAGDTNVKNVCFNINNQLKDLDKPVNVNMQSSVDFNIDRFDQFKINDFKFIFQIPKDKKTREGVCTLLEPFSFVLGPDGRIIIDKGMKVNLISERLHIANIAAYLPESIPLKVNDGFLRYDLQVDIPKELDVVKLKGKYQFLYLNLNLAGKTIKNLSVLNTINAELCDSNIVKLKDTSTELYVNGVRGLLAKTDGVIVFDEVKDSTLTISVESVRKDLFNLFGDNISDNIKKVTADGKILFDYSGVDGTALIKGDITLHKGVLLSPLEQQKQPKFAGKFKFNLFGDNQVLELNRLNFFLTKDNKDILDVKTAGCFPFPIQNGMSRLLIASDCADLEELTNIYNALNKGRKIVEPASSKEYDPIDFNGLDLAGDIDLKNITYGKLIKSKFKGGFSLRNNRISVFQKDAKINNTDVIFRGHIDVGRPNGFSYELASEFSDLDLNPFIKTFISGEYQKPKGTVDKFNISVSGKGFSDENLKKNLKGKLNIILSDLSLPYQIEQYKSLKVLLLPLEILGKIRERIPAGLSVANWEKGVQETKDIFTNLDNINLETGEISLAAKNGKVDLSKVSFQGGNDGVIRYSNFYGSVGYDGTLDLQVRSDISGVRLPFNIYGTIEKPETQFAVLLPRFLTINTLNVLNPMNLVDFILDAGEGIGNTIGSASSALFYDKKTD